MRIQQYVCLLLLSLLTTHPNFTHAQQSDPRPNILWIVGEDASAHLGCYGEKTISTPHLDQFASQGVRFTNAFVTSPVCSPSRSAMITGMFPATIGAHNHRSQQTVLKASGNSAYYKSYELPDDIPFLPALFQQAGYFTTLGKGPQCSELGKTDYNFLFNPSSYHAADWHFCPDDRPFFAQIMLTGGKNRGGVRHYATDPVSVNLPPYYPDHPTLRREWAEYLNTWIRMDEQVGQILANLERAGKAENTIVFFWTDHGLTHIRSKQFLYDAGIHVPLIIRFGDRRLANTVRTDLVQQIDIAATSLALAGIELPATMQGQDLFAADYQPQKKIYAARDRCDETVDIIRCVRTPRYKYIRNFLSYLSHTQPNESKDHQPVLIATKKLYQQGKLNTAQSMAFTSTRPREELYDLQTDPHETVNLATDPNYADELKRHRTDLYQQMIHTGDLGLIPEPILEELGRNHQNKALALDAPENQHLVADLIELFDAGEDANQEKQFAALQSSRPSLRYWAATWLGVQGIEEATQPLIQLLQDDQPAVQIAAALALLRLGKQQSVALEVLINTTRDFNPLVALYAIRALEIANINNPAVRQTFLAAQNHPYEFARRIANRVIGQNE